MAKAKVRVPAAAVAVGGIVGGYAVARFTKKRPLGGAVLAAAGAVAARQWQQRAGGRTAAALSTAYVAAFAGSHPLAKKVGAWPAVLGVASAVGVASWVVVERRER
ncbi:hypothetical protein [Streptomyces sp. NPDC059063]|uniref:hypothetical protein n=1 Tax=unclassified Streptomyces TaxID=2593676 RepID=UPI0036B9F617